MLLGSYAQGDNGVEAVLTRKLTYTPHKYTSMSFARCYTPKEAWETMGAAIIANGDEVLCKPLLDSLRVATTKRGGYYD